MSLTLHQQVWPRMLRAVDEGMIEFFEMMTENAKEWLSEPYPPASLPGFPPHLRTGDLRGNMWWFAAGNINGSGGKRYYLANSSEHAIFLELGTSKMAPRPFMRPLIEMYQDLIASTIAKKVEKV